MADWNPELYNRFRRYREEPFLAILERLTLRGDESIIDLGCGSGENTVELARRAPKGRALGIDSSAAMIQAANKVRKDLEPKLKRRVSFREGDVREFDADREYSLVFSNATLQWVPNHREVFKKIFTALVPGGRVVVQMPKNDRETTQMTILKLAGEPPWKELLGPVMVPSRSVPGPDHYDNLLTEIGFAEVKCYDHVFQHPMRNTGDIVEWSRATTLRPFLDVLAEDKHEGFLSVLVQRLNKAYATDGPLILPFRRLFIWARRPTES